ncbi:MAG TPA: hypothetical protein HPP77_06655, partial [Candidatus Hydrogenedentes bacterium]|nr:hypothetical protein [Candidatus Hydrogenedentota bacterium]
PDGARRIAVLDEVDYVSGASTGAIPAAAFALNRTETCPETVRFAHWPDCFNANLTGRVMRHELMRPDRILRDVVLGPNVGPAVTGAMAAAFFDGNAHCPASGLTFGDLPQTPVLLVGATVVNDPAVPFIHTRLPYRYCIDTYPHTTWGIGVQTFESFHADPMTYALGQAAYNSSSFPGYMRSGLMAVRADQAWVFEGLEGAARERLERARHQPGYGGVYELKDGGLVDNRAIAPIDRIFDAVASRGGWESRPLLIALDAGYLDIRQPEKGANLLGKGWSSEVYAVMRASWQTGQYAYERLFDKNVADGVYAHARFRLTAWTRYLTGTVPSEQSEPGLSPFSRPSEGHSEPGPSPFPPSPEADYLRKLCRQAPAIGTPSRLLEALRGIGTTLTDLSERQMDALRVAAEFAVWHEKDALIAWASAIYDGAPARFAPSG